MTQIKNKNLTNELAAVLDADCTECAENGVEQNFTVTDTYIDDGEGGVFAMIRCHNCKTITDSGDGEFHNHYKIIDNQFVVRK